ENTGVLTSEPIEADDPISLSDGRIRETNTAEAEILNEISEEDSPRLKSGRYNTKSDKEVTETGEVTKRISSWFSDVWIASQVTHGEVPDKDDPECDHFKKGLLDNFDNVRSTLESVSQ